MSVKKHCTAIYMKSVNRARCISHELCIKCTRDSNVRPLIRSNLLAFNSISILSNHFKRVLMAFWHAKLYIQILSVKTNDEITAKYVRLNGKLPNLPRELRNYKNVLFTFQWLSPPGWRSCWILKLAKERIRKILQWLWIVCRLLFLCASSSNFVLLTFPYMKG